MNTICSTYSSDVPTMDICEEMANTTMCPSCDKFCDFHKLGVACLMTQAKYLFDNATTVFYAVFMSIWAVIFTEMWRRNSAEITHRWDVFGYGNSPSPPSPPFHLNTSCVDPEGEHPRPEYLAKLTDVEERHINFVTQTTEPRPPFWRMKMPGVLISWASVLFFIMLALVTVVAIILYRMSMIVALATVTDKLIKYEKLIASRLSSFPSLPEVTGPSSSQPQGPPST